VPDNFLSKSLQTTAGIIRVLLKKSIKLFLHFISRTLETRNKVYSKVQIVNKNAKIISKNTIFLRINIQVSLPFPLE